MIKKNPFGDSLREQLEASARDRIHSFILDYGGLRGALVCGTRMVSEMQANHELGSLETLVLGHAYLAAALMSSNLKAPDRIHLGIECTGPVRGLSVEANAFGEVRGYLRQDPVPADGIPGDSIPRDSIPRDQMSPLQYHGGDRSWWAAGGWPSCATAAVSASPVSSVPCPPRNCGTSWNKGRFRLSPRA